MFRMSLFVWLLVLPIFLFLFSCSDNIVESDEDNEAQLAPSWWDELQMNQKILAEAKLWNGLQGGQCKPWVSKVVQNATGKTLPATYEICDTYYEAKWVSSPNVRVVWQGAYQNIVRFPSLLPGQMIQLRWRNSVPNFGGGPHTAIIKSVSDTTMEWWDSNYVGALKVGSHVYSLNKWNQEVAAWTVYQLQ